jgi:hypothetical protein
LINISELAVIWAVQAFLVLAIGLVIFIILNHKLRARVNTLVSWLDQLKVKTTELLAASSTLEKTSYTDYLDEEMRLTTSRFEQLHPDRLIGVDSTNSVDENLTALRHLFLQAEITAAPIADEAEKWHQIGQTLDLIVSNFFGTELSSDNSTDIPADMSEDAKEDLAFDIAQKWQELCAAAVYAFENNNNETRDAFINLLQIINNELGFAAIAIPDFVVKKIVNVKGVKIPAVNEAEQEESSEDAAKEDSGFAETIELRSPAIIGKGDSPSSPAAIERRNHRIDVEKLKETTSRQQALIDSLQQENQNASSTISLKASELDQLQSFFDEATECLERIEKELEASISRTTELEGELEVVPDMKALIRRFTEESSDMLTCIETLEKENETLRQGKAG